MTLEVDADDRIPLLLGHVEAHLVAQDPRVVDEDVETTKPFDGLIDETFGAVPARAVVEVGGRDAAVAGDLINDLLRRGLVGAFAARRPAQVVHHHLRAFRREQQRLAATDPAPGARDDRDLAVEQTHALPPPRVRRRSTFPRAATGRH